MPLAGRFGSLADVMTTVRKQAHQIVDVLPRIKQESHLRRRIEGDSIGISHKEPPSLRAFPVHFRCTCEALLQKERTACQAPNGR